MTTVEFLAQLRGLDVKLWAEGDRLRYNVARGLMTPALLKELTERKAEILHFLAGAVAAERASSQTIQPVARDQNLPLSFAQQRLWFLDQLVPGNPFYNEYIGLRFNVPLNTDALEQSLNEAVPRHEALRPSFATVAGAPVQVIAPSLRLPLPLTDLRRLPAAEREAEARRLAQEEAQQPFELSRGPLLRAALLRLGEADFIFLLTMHHIISDTWSMGIFFRELTTLYQSFL